MHSIKTGIIIIFSDDENNIDKNQFINLDNDKEIKICFVNNGSKDNTLDVLKSVKVNAETTISILDIKKNKGTIAAVKAGARFLFSEDNLKYILFLKSDRLNYFKNLKRPLEFFKKIDYTLSYNEAQKNKKKILQKVFSFDDFLLL